MLALERIANILQIMNANLATVAKTMIDARPIGRSSNRAVSQTEQVGISLTRGRKRADRDRLATSTAPPRRTQKRIANWPGAPFRPLVKRSHLRVMTP